MRQFVFMAGLPRSGSTMLSALLGQRPDVHAPGITNTPNALVFADKGMSEDESFRLGTNHKQRESLILNILPAMYAHVAEPIVLDKSRLWAIPYYVDVLTHVLGSRPKILMPVRPLREIIASFIRMCHDHPDNFIDQGLREENLSSLYRRPLDDARVDYLLGLNGHLGLSILGLHNAMQPHNADVFHVVTYSSLVHDAPNVLRDIDEFLGWDTFEYDLTNIRGVSYNDAALGLPGMHHVRKELSPSSTDPESVLSAYALARCDAEDFWT